MEYYRITLGVLQDNLGGGYKDNLGGILQDSLGESITRQLRGVLQDNLGEYYKIP